MHTLRFIEGKVYLEKVLTAVGILWMELTGLVLLICVILGVKPF